MRAALLILLLSAAGLTKGYANYYNVTIGVLRYDLYTSTHMATVLGHVDGTSATGGLLIPENVTYGSVSYSVTEIGNYAFLNCSGFTGDLTIPNSVTTIESAAFYGCSGFTGSLTIGNSVTSIGGHAFEWCTGFNGSLTIGNSVTSIGERAFHGCTGLTSVTIGNSVTSIGGSAFYYCTGLTSVTIGNSVTSIEIEAFRECTSLTSVEIPNSVTSIANGAFYYCTGLTSVTIGNSVTSIGICAFYGCSSLTSITIPNSVTSIGIDAFRGCTGLAIMTVLAETPPGLGDGVFYQVDTSIPVFVPVGTVPAYQSAFGWNEFTNYYDMGIYAQITATANPEAGGTVSGAGTYDHGATATLTATANDGYTFINWTKDGEEVSTESTYSFEVTEASAFVANFEQTAVTQTTNFASGWNWWSTYIDAGDVLTQLESGLVPNGQTIKSKSKSRIYRNGSWMGGLDAIEAEGSYRVQTSAACTVDITGTAVTPSAHPITLTPGWTWIGYPSTATMTVTEALANLTPTQGDVIKSKNKTAVYRNGAWMSSFTITPGTGLMYKSSATTNLTLVYPSSDAKGEAAVEEADNLHWTPNASAYPGNMTVIAVVELDGAELAPEPVEGAEGYELAAFADGECRGSFRLMPVEGRCMAILTVAGDEAAGLRFALYDAATGEEWHDATQSLNYETDAVVGDIDAPYVVRFRSAGVEEWESSLNVYPNPVGRGQKVSLGLDAGTTGKVQVEIINALGVVVETRRATTAQTEIAAPGEAGVYTLRIAVEGKGACHRKLVVR